MHIFNSESVCDCHRQILCNSWPHKLRTEENSQVCLYGHFDCKFRIFLDSHSIHLFQVWLLSILISVPPLIGWNDWNTQKLKDHCELSSEKAFVVFSASGSFFLPLLVMIIVYVKIFLSARQRIRTNRGTLHYLRDERLRIQREQGEAKGATHRHCRGTKGNRVQRRRNT